MAGRKSSNCAPELVNTLYIMTSHCEIVDVFNQFGPCGREGEYIRDSSWIRDEGLGTRRTFPVQYTGTASYLLRE